MTKVTILGQEPKEEKKPIEFKLWINDHGGYRDDITKQANTWDEVMLICKNYRGGGLDLMLTKSNSFEFKECLYLGHFNDGVV